MKNQKTLEYWISKMSIIQSQQITYEITENNIKINNKKSDDIVEKIYNFSHEHYNEDLKIYLVNNKDYIVKFKKLPLSKEANSLELNKSLMKIKKQFEEYIK